MIDRTNAKSVFSDEKLFKCPLCKEQIMLSERKLWHIRDIFEIVIVSYVKGHLKELPARSDT
jgi:hypothetical protein